MARRAASAAVATTVLASVLALGASPALAAGNHPAAGTPVGLRATLLIHTVPRIQGVRVFLDGRGYQTDSQGFVAIPTTSGGHRIHILRPRSHPAGTTVTFSRWLDGIALTDRTILLSPGTNVEQAGFVVSHPIAVRFADTRGRPVALSSVTRLTIDSSLGKRFTFSPARPPRALAANRIVRNSVGLVPLAIRYSVRDVVIDGANVVYGGSQNFYVHRSRTWTVKVLLFPLRIKVRDALFGFPIGSAVRLILPDGSSRIVTLGAGNAVTVTGLPRATYQLVAKGPGFGLASQSSLSKPQVARLLLLSWVDIIAVVTFLALFLVGLPVLGGRIVRRQGGIRLPVWHVGRPREFPPEAAPQSTAEEDADGTPVPGSGTEEPAAGTEEPAAGAEEPRTAVPEGEVDGEAPAIPAAWEDEVDGEAPAIPAVWEDEVDSAAPAIPAACDDEVDGEAPAIPAEWPWDDEVDSAAPAIPAAWDDEVATEVFAAITDNSPAERPGQSAGLDAADHHASPVGSPDKAHRRAFSATSAACLAAAADRNGASVSVPPPAGWPAYSRPVSSWVKRTTWPSWKKGQE